MINVTSYGATGDWNGTTGTDNKTPIENAILAANANGDEIYFPPGKYLVKSPVDKTSLNNLRFYGTGATIVSIPITGSSGSTNNGVGGGLTLFGNNIIVEGLSFLGYQATSETDTNNTLGRLLRLNGNDCVVKNCYFKNTNDAAIEFAGSYNLINGNVFENCNDYNGSGDYGAIHISGNSTTPSKYNTISENKIFGQYHSGISAYGSGDSNYYVSYIDILSNYIRSNSSSSSIDHSMGIYLINGANKNIKIIGNTIETIDAEGILIASATAYPSSKCIISNNIIRDCDYMGISLPSTVSDSGATYTDYLITNNIIENTSNSIHYSQHIGLDRVQDSIISNNKCIGVKNGSSYVGVGINFNDSCPRNQVCDNQLRTLSTGIVFCSPDGALKDNHVYDCDKGITLAYCLGASIVGNIVNRCITGVYYDTSSSPLHVLGNAIMECTNRYGVASGISIAPETMTLSGRADSGSSSYSSFVVTGTLVAGVKTITFYHVYTGDRFLVLPANQSGNGIGAMYVSLIDVTNSQVTVKSTDVNDARDFMLIKVVSGG